MMVGHLRRSYIVHSDAEIESDTKEHRYLSSIPGIYDRHIEMYEFAGPVKSV
jgi:hypothetical protein